jgi:type IV pilus assembly protein PilW
MSRTRGFSLVEFMVAVTLSLFVTIAVLSVFVSSRSAFQATSGVAALSDSGRFALTFLENAVRDAGNMACGAPNRTIINVFPEATPLYYTVGAASGLFQPMTGFEAANTGNGNSYTVAATPGALANWNPTLDAAFSSLSPAPLPIKNSDILVVRSSTQGGQPAFVTTSDSSTLTLNSVPSTITAGQMAVVSDCTKSLVFQVTNVTGNVISHGTSGSPGNLAAAFVSNIMFGAGSQVTPLETTAYFIGVGADGDGALFSADVTSANTLTANELVPDIEAMQILYGLDTTGSQTVSEYVTADAVTDFTSVMSVQIALLAAGPPGSATLPAAGAPANTYNLFGTIVTAPKDTRARQVFEVTIASRNLLP